MKLLRKRHRRIIIGQLPCLSGVLARERDAVVDIEDAVAAAGRPDGRRGFDAVLLGVDLAVLQGAAALEGGAGCLLFGMSDNDGISVDVYVGGLTVLLASCEK